MCASPASTLEELCVVLRLTPALRCTEPRMALQRVGNAGGSHPQLKTACAERLNAPVLSNPDDRLPNVLDGLCTPTQFLADYAA